MGLRQLAQQIWPEKKDSKHSNKKIVEFLEARVHFPLINEKLVLNTVSSFNKVKCQLSFQIHILLINLEKKAQRSKRNNWG